MIDSPKEDKLRAAGRILVESLCQGWPIAAGLAHIYRFTHPSEMEQAVQGWRSEITSVVNDHDRLLRALESELSPRSQISPTALVLAV